MSTGLLAPSLARGEAVVMPTSSARAINLSFSDAITVLIDACGLPAAGRHALEARVRQLQRLGVPKREHRQRATSFDYGIAELAALATAIKLMDAFMTPARAARYVTERWRSLAPFLLAGARDVLPADYLARRPIRSGTIALFDGNALADLGGKGRHDARHEGPLGGIVIMHADAIGAPLVARGAGLVLDSTAFTPVLVQRAAALSMATDADLAAELDRLRFVN